jgi:uncharacterized protein
MDRLFLDANVLFSASYRRDSGLLRFWRLKNVMLCSSHYAIEEARINLAEETQRRRLARLAGSLQIYDAPSLDLPRGLSLPEKDIPIFLAAMAARATHLVTGDFRHFGPYFSKTLQGILILPPREYFKRRTGHRR